LTDPAKGVNKGCTALQYLQHNINSTYTEGKIKGTFLFATQMTQSKEMIHKQPKKINA
jgi:hypothetical protein